MKKPIAVAAFSALSLFLASGAFAQPPGPPGMPPGPPPGAMPGMYPGMMPGMMPHGHHSVSGTISKLDHEKGMVSLQTGAGTLELHFPPQSIADLKEGDSITVHLSFSKTPPGPGGMPEKSEEKHEQKHD
jgi:hypothetical protein